MLSINIDVGVYISASSTPIKVAALRKYNILENISDIVQPLLKNYISLSLSSAPSLLASVELLGNPQMIINNLSCGIKDFFLLPISGAEHGIFGGIIGLMNGSKSLVTHIGKSTLTSISGISFGAARNLQLLDREYAQDRRNKFSHPPKGAVEGLSKGVEGLATGVFDGVTGILTSPIKKTREQGVAGLATGITQGLFGFISKPVGGVFDLVSMTTQGLLNEMDDSIPRSRNTPLHHCEFLIQKFVLKNIVEEFDVGFAATLKDNVVWVIISHDKCVVINNNMETVLEEAEFFVNGSRLLVGNIEIDIDDTSSTIVHNYVSSATNNNEHI
eukprot:TRINITY_DN5102_c0_g1_i1.p1 TRINITY_DN5102_c0_g1~~TRINITY_DN5102_c0_g1_i1.p1  ORF type:complete len:330 (+),score=72.92 TRINITY_DN5102_c0_g1_i1:296-1285(+)